MGTSVPDGVPEAPTRWGCGHFACQGAGAEPGPPGPAFLPRPLSGFKMSGLHSAPAGLSGRE